MKLSEFKEKYGVEGVSWAMRHIADKIRFGYQYSVEGRDPAAKALEAMADDLESVLKETCP